VSLHRHAAKRDDVEKDIVTTWTNAGARSESISAKGMPDRLVFYRGRTYLAEVKGARRGLTEEQVKKFTSLGTDGIPVYVVRTGEAARSLLAGTLAPWSPSQGAAAGAQTKGRKHVPGKSRMRTVEERCREDFCATSHAPGSLYCIEHGKTDAVPPPRRRAP
jgi:hypothetical protein